MNKFTLCIMVVVTSVLLNPVWAEQNEAEQPLRLELTLIDGSRVIGIPTIDVIPVETVYAKMNVPLKQILTMKIGDDRETVSFSLQNGDKLKGVVKIEPIKLETVFGKVSVNLEHIKQLDVVLAGRAFSQKGLVLWNRLGSENDVNNSRVGPGGKLNGGHFVPGRFGQSLELNMQEQFGVTFPVDIMSASAGCIEFWAKLVDFPQVLPWGAKPGLIGMGDKEDNRGFMLQFNGNDGASNGGLCACLGGIGSAGTAQYGSWTYARALGTEAVGEWHHYALVWSSGGLPGVADGTRRVAVFVDGRLNTGSWNGTVIPPGPLVIPNEGRLGLLCHQSQSSGRVAFDNIKIWNYAKTDFSDRTDE